jgi:hypothetical protein
MEAALEQIAQRRREYDALDTTIRDRVPFTRWLAFNTRQRAAQFDDAAVSVWGSEGVWMGE